MSVNSLGLLQNPWSIGSRFWKNQSLANTNNRPMISVSDVIKLNDDIRVQTDSTSVAWCLDSVLHYSIKTRNLDAGEIRLMKSYRLLWPWWDRIQYMKLWAAVWFITRKGEGRTLRNSDWNWTASSWVVSRDFDKESSMYVTRSWTADVFKLNSNSTQLNSTENYGRRCLTPLSPHRNYILS